MFSKDNMWKIVMFASLGVMSLVLLITSSIWMHEVNKEGALVSNSQNSEAITSVVFVVLGLVATLVSGTVTFKNGISKITLFILFAALLMFIIGSAIPMDDQRQAFKNFQDAPVGTSDLLSGSTLAALRVFPVALTFLLVPGFTFLGSGFMVAKEEALF